MSFTSGEVRKLLQAVLRTDADLHAFCIDCRLPAASRFSEGMDRVAKVNLLLQLHEPDELLSLLRKYAPERTMRELATLGAAATKTSTEQTLTWPSPAPIPRRSAGDERRVTIGLELDAQRRLRVSYHVPVYDRLAEAPAVELSLLETLAPQLQYDGQHGLAAIARLLDKGSESDLQRWLTGAAVTGETALGQLLYRTLFPDESIERRVLAYLLDETRPEVALSPIRHGVQVRIWTSARELLGLPWRLTCWKGNLLSDNGWTFAVTPDLGGHHPVRLSALSRILVLAPQVTSLPDLNTKAHVDELRSQLAAGIPEQGEDEWFLVVQNRAELDRALRTMPFDVLYYYGHGCIAEGQVCLQLGEGRHPQALLTISDLKQMVGDAPPQLALLSGCFSGAAGWQGAGHLLSPHVPVVVCSLTTAYTHFAGAFAIRWLKGCLLDRRDPVELVHRRDPSDLAQTQHDFQWATHAVFASYTSWEPTPLLARRRDPRNPQRLDRIAARAQVIEQVCALRDGRRRRVEALVAYAHDRSLLERFSWQATDHIERRRVAPVFTVSLQFPHERAELYARLSEDFRRQVAHPREPMGHALRRHAPKVRSAGMPVLWLNWGVCGDGTMQKKLDLLQLRCWLKWSSEFLSHDHHCPEDLRIVSFIALRVEASKHEILRRKVEDYKLEFNSERFRAFLLPPLPKVEKGELKDYLSDPDYTSCADNANTVMKATDLIYQDTDGHYEQVVEHIEWAEKHGWQSLIDELRKRHEPHSQAAEPEDI